MTPETAKELTHAVKAAFDALSRICQDIDPERSDAHALLRLHVAGTLNAIVTYLLLPVWRDFPETAPAGAEPGHTRFRKFAESIGGTGRVLYHCYDKRLG